MKSFEGQREELFGSYRGLLREIETEKEEKRQAEIRQMMEAAERAKRLSQEHAPRAKELCELFATSIQNRNARKAEETLNELQTENIGLGLLKVLGSPAKRAMFYASAENQLRFLVDMEERRRMQLKTHRKIPVLGRQHTSTLNGD